MLFLLSPAKNLNEQRPAPTAEHTQAQLLSEAEILMQTLKQFSAAQIAELMQVSENIACLNATRNAAWQTPFDLANAKQALYLFDGDVYEGLDAATLPAQGIAYLQDNLRILSGLYGLLRPLDLIQPYRLEMGTALANPRGKNLYEFWGQGIGAALIDTLRAQGGNTLINLASQEYFKAVRLPENSVRIITPQFKDEKNGTYKIISFYAKRARGLMVRYAAEKQLRHAEDLKNFDCEGYRFDDKSSNEHEWVFLRAEKA